MVYFVNRFAVGYLGGFGSIFFMNRIELGTVRLGFRFIDGIEVSSFLEVLFFYM